MILGLCRLGNRLGVRVLASNAQQVSEKLKPDTVFLESGSRAVYEVGPLPFGMDRLTVTKLCTNIKWQARPLHPTRSVGALGTVWRVQASCDPPQNAFAYQGGNILITKLQSLDMPTMEQQPQLLAKPATLAKVSISADPLTGTDPWLQKDPWGGAKTNVPPILPASVIEDRISSRILEHLHKEKQVMEVDDCNADGRLEQLEQQMKGLQSARLGLEKKVDDVAKRSDAQVQQLQLSVGAQFEAQGNRMQELFDRQMQHLESLLAKRARNHE